MSLALAVDGSARRWRGPGLHLCPGPARRGRHAPQRGTPCSESARSSGSASQGGFWVGGGTGGLSLTTSCTPQPASTAVQPPPCAPARSEPSHAACPRGPAAAWTGGSSSSCSRCSARCPLGPLHSLLLRMTKWLQPPSMTERVPDADTGGTRRGTSRGGRSRRWRTPGRACSRRGPMSPWRPRRRPRRRRLQTLGKLALLSTGAPCRTVMVAAWQEAAVEAEPEQAEAEAEEPPAEGEAEALGASIHSGNEAVGLGRFKRECALRSDAHGCTDLSNHRSMGIHSPFEISFANVQDTGLLRIKLSA